MNLLGQAAVLGASSLSIHPMAVLYYAASAAIAVVVHEYAHAVVASRLGDHSARSMGRLTLNPRAHIDTFGTIVFPAILLLPVLFRGAGIMFAYAKPMPVNPWNLKSQNRDQVLIWTAGIAANLVLAFVLGVILIPACGIPVLQDFLAVCVGLNVLFAAIHVVPMPPLDGARIIAPFLSPRAREVMANLEQYAPLFILLVFFILGGVFFDFVGAIAQGIYSLIPGSSCAGL